MRRRAVLLAGGETTSADLRGLPGRGGRNLEFVVGAAIDSPGRRRRGPVRRFGRHRPSRAAGAVADGGTLARARRRGLDPGAALDRHDTEPFFDSLGDLVAPGPTGTNVCDWAFALRPIR
jgi:hydroxypyruvate reductase